MVNWKAKVAETLLDTGGDLAKAWVRARLDPTRDNFTKPSALASTTNPEFFCPYCEATKALAATYRYLLRADVKPQLLPLYQELARMQVEEALTIIDVVPTPSNPTHYALIKGLQQLAIIFAKPLEQSEIEQVARLTWQVSDVAMDMAEWLNIPTAKDNVVDAEAHVVS